MKNTQAKIQKKQRGQGMTEYIIIVAMVAIAAIAVYQLFGKTVRSQTASIAMELSGQSGAVANQNAKDAATAAVGKANETQHLGAYTGQNAGN